MSNFVDGVIAPGAQSIFTGLLAGLAAGALTSATSSLNPYSIGLLAGSASSLLSWMAFQNRWMSMIEIERCGERQVLEEPPAQQLLPVRREPVRIELVSNNGQCEEWIDLPYPEKLPALASGILTGRQFAQSVWCGGRGIFSRSEFEELRGVMLRRGLLRWRNEREHAQGVDITPAGRAILRHLASPTLSGEQG